MGTRYGKRIVTDGLVLCLDAADNISAPHNDLPVKRGCLMWLDGADDSVFTYSSGTSVSEWRDKSGNSNHVSNSNGTYQPSRNVTINSKSAVNFSSDSLQATNVFSSTATSYTKIAVVYQTSNTTGNVISSNTGHAFYFGGSTQIRLYHNGTFVTSSVTLANNTAGIISGTVQYNSSSSASGEVFVNGTSGGTGTTSNATINSTTVEIGSFAGGNYYTGYIAEVLVYDRVLSSDELTKVHNYLQNKWNIKVSDSKWYDRTASGLNGSFNGQPIYSETNKGYFYTDGTDDYISTSDSSILDISGDKSLAIWVYLGADSSGCGFAGKAHSTEKGMALAYGWNSQGFQNIAWNSRNAPQLSKDSSRDLQKWIYLVGTQAGSTRYIYAVDSQGTRSASDSGGGTHTWVNQHGLIIGRVASGSAVPSGTRFGSVSVYNKALSSAEILQNYNATKGRYL